MRTENFVPPYLTVKLGAIFILYVLIAISGCTFGKTRVTIENKGPNPLRSVTVMVTGNRYDIGDIHPGASTSVVVSVTGESHIELSQADGPRLILDVYLEPGYGGEINATVTPDSVLSVKHDVNIVPF